MAFEFNITVAIPVPYPRRKKTPNMTKMSMILGKHPIVMAMSPGLHTIRFRLIALAKSIVPSRLSRKFGESDLVQDALVEISRDYPKFRGQSEGELMAWAYAVLQRTALDHVKRYAAAKRNPSRERELRDGVHCRQSKPDEEAEFNELIALRMAALGRLPDKQRWVIEQRDLFARSYAELIAETGMTEMALRKLYSRAIVAWKAEAKIRDTH